MQINNRIAFPANSRATLKLRDVLEHVADSGIAFPANSRATLKPFPTAQA